MSLWSAETAYVSSNEPASRINSADAITPWWQISASPLETVLADAALIDGVKPRPSPNTHG